ncbi:MAG: tetratricopeptide repeat protein [Fimbriimonadaceae bacterium]|nr:tetratricopeptide repeat protein [Fimbriimonadaceae bacterium]
MKKWMIIAGLGLGLTSVVAPALAQEQSNPPTPPRQNRQATQKVIDAIKLHEDGDTSGAITALKAVNSEFPDNEDALNWLSYLLVQTEQYAEATPYLEKIVASNPADTRALNDLAVVYRRTDRRADAINALKELEKHEPARADIQAILGSLYLEVPDSANAIVHLERANDLAPNNADILNNLGVAYIEANRTQDAKRVFTALLQADGANVTALSWLGYMAMVDGDYSTAVMHLEKARSLQPSDLEVLNNLATSYMKSTPARHSEAKGIYEAIIRERSDLFEPNYNLGVCCQALRLPEQAVQAYTRALALRPDDPYSWNNLGRAHEDLGHVNEAANAYMKASDLRMSDRVFAQNAAVAALKANHAQSGKYVQRALDNGSDDVDLVLVLAEAYHREGKDAEAVRVLEAVQPQFGNNADYWFNLGVLRFALGDKSAAAAAYKRAYDLDKSDTDALRNLGLIEYEAGNYTEALGHFRALLQREPTDTDAQINMAAALHKTGATAEAVEVWRGLVRSNPRRNDLRMDLANGLWALGETQQARFHYATILQSEPNNVYALNGMGLWHLLQASNQEAEKSFRAAMSANKNFLPAYNNLAVALERLNRRTEAIIVLEQALKIDANFEDAKRNLERMKAAAG